MNIVNKYHSAGSGSPLVSLVRWFLLTKKSIRGNSSLNLQQFKIYVVNIDDFNLFTELI